MGSTQLTSLNYNGAVIRDRGEMLSLTDMWKAAGADEAKRPSEWLRQEATREFVEIVAASNMGQNHISTRRGNNGGTFANWQIGLAYAKYLSPEFHMWCNEVVRERMEGRAHGAVSPDTLEQIERSFGIVRMLAHKVTEIEKTLPAILDERIEARIAADSRVAVVSYVSVKQMLENEWKVPSKGRRSIQRKVFLRLSAYCLANGIKAFKCAHSGTWLFPPHEAGAFVREHCTGIIQEHLARLRGQGSLRLVGKAA